LFQAGKLLAQRIEARLTADTVVRLRTLIGVGDVLDDDDDEPGLVRMIKSAPGGVSVSTMEKEIGKLTAIRAFGLPENLFACVGSRMLGFHRHFGETGDHDVR
jgi:hypothetical protein